MGNTEKQTKQIAKKGLLVGINYTGTGSALNGCINDTDNLRQFLIKNKYFNETDLTFMNDTKSNGLYPSKANIEKQMNELVKFANANDDKDVYLFFSYSGHGYHIDDTNGDEKDGQDECLCPIDYEDNGFIIDDDIRKNLVNKLGKNVTLVVLIDACHSGSILDLKYMYNCDAKNTNVQEKTVDTNCNIIMISGCKDVQTSADAFIDDNVTKIKEFQGAMTAAFIMHYTDEIPAKKLVTNMRTWLKKEGYSQIPQLSSGKLMDANKPFLLSVYNN